MDFKISINALFPFLILLQGFLFATLLILRGRREERYSDLWLALLLMLQALSVIPFLLGWLGINYLWEKLTFLPWDGYGWAVVPTSFLFLKSLTNEAWRFKWRQDGKHFIPYLTLFFYHLTIGGYGLWHHEFVLHWWNDIEHQYFISETLLILGYVQAFIYYYLGWQLYKSYQAWTATQFSDLDRVSYKWFRNFLIFNFIVTCAELINTVYLYLVVFGYDRMWLSYGANMILTYYLSISGFVQTRIRGVLFIPQNNETLFAHNEAENIENTDLSREYREGGIPTEISETVVGVSNKNILSDEELLVWKAKLSQLMATKQLYLQQLSGLKVATF